jgi:hypothetical protein
VKRVRLLIFLVLVSAGNVSGQIYPRARFPQFPLPDAELPRFELSADFSAIGGEFTQPNGPALGARTRFDWNPTSEFGWIVDFGGYQYRAPGKNSSIYTLMTGPKWTLDHKEHFTFYLDGLVGQALLGAKLAQARNSKFHGIVALGGGMDFPITRRVAFRLIEMQFVFVGSPSTALGGGRISSGVVIRFGGS